MTRIDRYIAHLTRLQSTGIVFTSDQQVSFRFPTGERTATQSTPHVELAAMVDEVASPAARSAIRSGQKAVFAHRCDDVAYRVTVEPRGSALRVLVEPGDVPEGREAMGSRPEIAPAPAPAPRAALSSSNDLAAGMHTIEVPFGQPERPAPAPPRPREASTLVTGAVESRRAPQPVAPAAAVPSRVASPATASGKLIDRMLVQMKEMGASDLHVSSTNAPRVRLHGEMRELPGYGEFTPEQTLAMLYEITPEKNQREFEERHDTDFAHMIPKVSRFRANMFRDRHGPGAVFRQIPFEILTPEQIGLPKKVMELCYLTKGLVVVTGPTGSGKSTTLATMVDFVNKNRKDHIITIEDPIEFVHENKGCLVNQREVHTHTRSFKDALRAALREDPDIVLVGELRDLETVAIAIETAETGHLVFGTLHTTTAPSTVDRIVDQFPADRQEQIRQMVSESLRGVIAQTLCKKIGGGRVAAYEVLLGSTAVSNLIRERKTFQLFSLMQTSRAAGMVTLSDSLLDLVKRGVVDAKEAYMKAVNKSEFSGMLARENIPLKLDGT